MGYYHYHYDQTLTDSLLTTLDSGTSIFNSGTENEYTHTNTATGFYGGEWYYAGHYQLTSHIASEDDPHDSSWPASDGRDETDYYMNFKALNGVNFLNHSAHWSSFSLDCGDSTTVTGVTFGYANVTAAGHATLSNITFSSGGSVQLGVDYEDEGVHYATLHASLTNLSAAGDAGDFGTLYVMAGGRATVNGVTVNRNLNNLFIGGGYGYNTPEHPSSLGSGNSVANVTVSGALNSVFVGANDVLENLNVGSQRQWTVANQSAFMYVYEGGSANHSSATTMTIASGATARNIYLNNGGTVELLGPKDSTSSQWVGNAEHEGDPSYGHYEYTTSYGAGAGGLVSGLYVGAKADGSNVSALYFTDGNDEVRKSLWSEPYNYRYASAYQSGFLASAPQAAVVSFGSATSGTTVKIGNGGSMYVGKGAHVNGVTMNALAASLTVARADGSGDDLWIGDRGAKLTVEGGVMSGVTVDAIQKTFDYYSASHDYYYSHSSAYASADYEATGVHSSGSAWEARVMSGYRAYVSSRFGSDFASNYDNWVGGEVVIGGGGMVTNLSGFASLTVAGEGSHTSSMEAGGSFTYSAYSVENVLSATGKVRATVTVLAGAHLTSVTANGGYVVMGGSDYGAGVARMAGMANPQSNFSFVEHLDLTTADLPGGNHSAVVVFQSYPYSNQTISVNIVDADGDPVMEYVEGWGPQQKKQYFAVDCYDPGEIQYVSGNSGLTVSGVYGGYEHGYGFDHFTYTGTGTTVLDLGTVSQATYSAHYQSNGGVEKHWLTPTTEYLFGVVKGVVDYESESSTIMSTLVLRGDKGFNWTGTLAIGSGAIIQNVGSATGYAGGLKTANGAASTTWTPEVDPDKSKILHVVAGGSADNVKVVGAVSNYQRTSAAYSRSLAGLLVSSGGTATNVTVTNGGIAVAEGGTINGVLVDKNGVLVMSGWGGGWQVSEDDGQNVAGLQYHDSTTLNAVRFNAGGRLAVVTDTGFPSKAPSIVANANTGVMNGVTMLNGVAYASGLDFAGTLTFTSGQEGENLTVRAHETSHGNGNITTELAILNVSSGASVTGTIVKGADAWLQVKDGGIVNNTTVTSGGRAVFAESRWISGTGTVYSAGSATASGITISSGGMLEVNSKFALTADNVTLKNGAGIEFVVAGNASEDYAMSELSGTWAATWGGGQFQLHDGTLGGFGGQFGAVNPNGWLDGQLSMCVVNGGLVTGADLRGVGDVYVFSGGSLTQTHLRGVSAHIGKAPGYGSNALVGDGYASGLTATVAGNYAFDTQIEVLGEGAVADATLLSGGMLRVGSSGVVNSTTLVTPSGYRPGSGSEDDYPPTVMYVDRGGTANDTMASGGRIELWESGTMSNATVKAGAELRVVENGGFMTGALNLGGNVNTTTERGVWDDVQQRYVYSSNWTANAATLTVNYDLTQLTSTGKTAMIDNLENLTGAALGTITVKQKQTNTTYALAGGAAAWAELGDIAINCQVGANLVELGTLTVNGDILYARVGGVNYGNYQLTYDNGYLKLVVAGTGGGTSAAFVAPPSVNCDDAVTRNRRSVRLTANYGNDGDQAGAKKQYSTDNKTWKTYSGDLEITANGTYYFRTIDKNGNISAVTSYEVTNIATASWSHGARSIAARGTYNTGSIRLTLDSMYKLTGNFGTMTGIVQLRDWDTGDVLAEGTLNRGVLTFNDGKRVHLDGEQLCYLSIRNTGAAAVTISSMNLATPADERDNDPAAATFAPTVLTNPTQAGQTLIANGWVGYGDDVDHSRFTLAATKTKLVLALTATDATTFTLLNAAGEAVAGLAPVVVAPGEGQTIGTASFDCGELAAGTYYLKAESQSVLENPDPDPDPEAPEFAPTYRDSDYTVKTTTCLEIYEGTNVWNPALPNIAKGATQTYGLRLTEGSMYAFENQKIGNLTGTVTLTTADGAVLASGTVTNGKVTFNGGKRVKLEAGAVYGLTFKNTGKAAATLTLDLANAVNANDNAWDAEATPALPRPTAAGQTLIASAAGNVGAPAAGKGWVGLGDNVDYAQFTVAAPTLMSLVFSATAATTFELFNADDLEHAIATVNVAANGSSTLADFEFRDATYAVKATTAAEDSDYAVKTSKFIAIAEQDRVWSLGGARTLAKGASYAVALRMEKGTFYNLAGAFAATFTGTVTVATQAGTLVANGTVTNGKLAFNGGKRLRMDADGLYVLTVKNTGKASAAMTALNLAAAAGNADDEFDLDPESGFAPTVLAPTKPSQTLVSKGWVGYGDATDYSKFTLTTPTLMSLTLTATANTTFTLCDAAGNPVAGVDPVNVVANGAKVTATMNCGELRNGTYYLKATSESVLPDPEHPEIPAVYRDSDYTVATSQFVQIYEEPDSAFNLDGVIIIVKGGSHTVGLRMEQASFYNLSGNFGTLTGTVTLTRDGRTLATGTVTNGKLVFNGGRRVQIDSAALDDPETDALYMLTIKNTGKANANVSGLQFKTAAGNLDDAKDAEGVTQLNPTKASQTLIASGWVGLGDTADYAKFTLTKPTTMGLTFTATGTATFTLCDADGNEIEGKSVTLTANGAKATAVMDCGELDGDNEGKTYFVKVTATGGDADYTVATNTFVQTTVLGIAHWSLDNLGGNAKTTLAKGGAYSIGLRMPTASMYDFKGSNFGALTGTVTLTRAGATVATGTVTNGKLVFNGGRRVELAADTTYVLTVKNTGKAAANVPLMVFAAAADNADDTRATRADRGALTKAGAIVAKGAGWVGLGDVDDYSKFTLADPATTTLTVTATDKTTFTLYKVVDAEDPERDLQKGTITVNARGNQVSAALFSGELEAGEYYVVAHSVNAGDSDYTVTASSFVKTTVYERSWSQATTTLAKGASLTVGLNMGTASMYRLTGNFAKNKMNGTVTLTQGGVTIATGTIKNGTLTFNGGQKVEIAAGTTYLLTVKNTGTAAATVTNLSFAAAAGNGDDAKETATALAPSKASQALVSAGWVGLGDATDYYKFTLAKDTTMGLTFTATDKTTFELLDADGNAIAGKSVTISANGVKASAGLNLGELAAGDYFVRATSTNDGDSDYTIATNQFVATNDYANAWSLGKTTIAKGASLSYGMRMTKESMYALSGSFAATMNGTVTLTQGGVTVASGTIKAGKLTFNGGQRVEVADGETYILTVKNTGSAAVTINSMKLAASAVNTDDDFAHSKARGALTKAGQTLVSDWLGLGDDADYSTFTLSKSTDLSLTFTAKGNATFQLLDAEGNAIDGKSVSVIANGTAASATLNVGRGVAGTAYYVRATLDGGADCAYTVAANSGTKVYASDNTNDTLNAAAAKSNKLNANAVNSKKAIVGQTVTGWVGFGDAADFIKVAVSKAGKVSLALNAATAAAVKADKLDVKLFKANGAELALAASGSTLKTTAKLAAGTYYLGVSTSAVDGPAQYNNNYQVTAKWLAS